MEEISEEVKKIYGRSVKCPHCEKQMDRNTEEFVEHSKRYYHQACFEVRHADIQTRKELLEYICMLHEIKHPTGFIYRQIKDFEEIQGYSIRGMLTTLKYVHEIEGRPVKGNGIGVVEYFYEKAFSYYTNLFNIRDKNSELDFNNTEEVVYTTPPKARKNKTIDIGGL